MSEGTTQDQRRVDKAEADAKIAEAKAREANAKQKIKDQKAKDRERKSSAIKKLSKRAKIVVLLVLVGVILLAIAFVPGFISSFNKGTTVSEATLKKAVEISKLSTSEFSYNGIAAKVDENGNAIYHVYYEATADAGIKMEDIQFAIDENAKIITISLPEITINNPVIDESAMEYLPHDANVDLREVLEICKADVQNEIQNSPNIKEVALGNLKSTLEALLLPIIEDSGYTIEWNNVYVSDEVGDDNETE